MVAEVFPKFLYFNHRTIIPESYVKAEERLWLNDRRVRTMILRGDVADPR